MNSTSSRRTFIKVCATALAGAGAAACGATPTATPTKVPPTAAKEPASAAPTATKAPAPTAAPTVYKPKVQKVSIMTFSAWPAPTQRAENQYWQYIEKQLGFQLELNTVPSADTQAKLNTTIASGDIPDCIGLSAWSPTVVQAAMAGAFLKVDVLGLPKETRGLPGLAVIKPTTWANLALNGANYGVPTQAYEMGPASIMRKDWLTKLGLGVPTTTAELKTALEGFAKKDPDGNSKADTWGWGLCQGRTWAQGSWYLFYHAFGVPQKYGQAKDGSIIHADITDQMRAAVTFVRDIFQAGALNPDFTAQPFAAMRDEFAAGRNGGLTGAIAAIYDSPQYGAALRKVVPTAELFAPDPVKADGFERVTYRTPGHGTFTVVNGKYAKDLEAAWDIMRVISFWQDPANTTFINYGLKDIHHTIDANGNPVLTDKGTADIQFFRSWGARSTETYQTANFVSPDTLKNKIIPDSDRLLKLGVGDSSWGLWPDLGTDNPETELDKFATTTIEQMVMGKKPLSDWDAYVTDWKKRGGDRLLKGWNDAKQKAGR